MKIGWVGPEQVKFRGARKKIPVEHASFESPQCTLQGDGVTARFLLYQTPNAAKRIPTMWVLYDAENQTQHLLYGEGWPGAREAGSTRILKLLGET